MWIEVDRADIALAGFSILNLRREVHSLLALSANTE
jgi:hypothetical protein